MFDVLSVFAAMFTVSKTDSETPLLGHASNRPAPTLKVSIWRMSERIASGIAIVSSA